MATDNQPGDVKSAPVERVRREREFIREELEEMAIGRIKPGSTKGRHTTAIFDIPFLIDFIMQQKNDDYYRGVRVGVASGRSEVASMLEALVQTEVWDKALIEKATLAHKPAVAFKAVPVTEITKLIKAVRGEA